MDSGRKRKANDQQPTAPVKKIRLLNSNHAENTPSNVQKVGYKLLEQLERATDKTSRPIATLFKQLPSREELPDYYDFTKLPIAIDTIEKKLQQDAYPTVTTLESDLKRMVQNAKDYNTAGSDIYEDAERIRKLVYNYMKINNPEYSTNPQYVSFATLLPEGTEKTNGAAINGVGSKKGRRSTGVSAADIAEKSSSVAPSEPPAVSVEDQDYTGKTFQEAQEMLIAGMLRHADANGLEIYTPFANLPTRKLEDYYKLIRYPVSLKGVAKRIRGIHGRNEMTGVTDFKTWDAFSDEVSWIWRNAREYNEDGSDMYNLAGEFETDFKARLEHARSQVDEPEKLKLKLGAKPKVTLNLSQHRASPGVAIDNEALARQKQLVSAGVQGRHSETRASPVANGVRPTSAAMETGRPQSSHTGSDHGSVKMEKGVTQSPAPMLTNGVGGLMGPPSMRPPSEGPLLNGHALHSSYTFTAPTALPPTPVRPYSASESLLPGVTISTHPQLKLDIPYSLTINPHETLSQQSYTFTLPSTHYYLQISPTISKALSMGKQYKMFVTVNGSRLTQRDTTLHQDSGRRTHVYEGTLAPGVNRLEVEVAAAKDNEGKGLDIEKLTIFANLMKP
ncbi:hypothetical protein AMS68_001927 [Peltaster fructicola]|uniref:Bromo domain-containing protein n=1 Tax=Peltaster fructicola TaxID=286661 RepID=A0A6H0XPK2_9PEZI|nr:hypothetical protein AMS68_001927 [Peltaster fructicola]